MAANEVLARVFHLMEQSSDTIRGIRNMKRQSSRPILFGKLLHFFSFDLNFIRWTNRVKFEIKRKKNLLEAESEIRFRHVLAERNAVSVVGRIAVQATDVLVAVGHAVTGTERHVETVRSEQTDVADPSVPC